MDIISLASILEKSYSQYLETTFYFKDAEFRESFKNALSSGSLSKGPYLEGTPIFKSGTTSKKLLNELLSVDIDEAMIQALHGNRNLYSHQEKAIRCSYSGQNFLVATGTGSGKTESFLYPIILSLYEEYLKGTLTSGVRALILYPMNALANDQRDRLGDICGRLSKSNSNFDFTFGQYIGETPENEKDSYRNARRHIEERRPGELVLRSEMRNSPPNILLTNYSMLEYLLLRPQDSPLFDSIDSNNWRFIVLDEAHQYKGSKGSEMALLIRRLKHRIREGGGRSKFNCIATSATLMGKEEDRTKVAKFASDLFGEKFEDENIIQGEVKQIADTDSLDLISDDLLKFKDKEYLINTLLKYKIEFTQEEDYKVLLAKLLIKDTRSTALRKLVSGDPSTIKQIADKIFYDESDEQIKLAKLSLLVELLNSASLGANLSPLISLRYHFFLRTLEGVFISFHPQKKVTLQKNLNKTGSKEFEVALCRECGQHYLVGRIHDKKLIESIRNISLEDFNIEYFKPLVVDENDEPEEKNNIYSLCTVCSEISKTKLNCGHNSSIRVLKEEKQKDEDRKDQIKRCSSCGYHAAGHDPVREIVYGHDGPNAVIATSLFNNSDTERKKILAFADSRQEAAFFAWYLQKSYEDILSKNVLYDIIKKYNDPTREGLSLKELVYEYKEKLKSNNMIPASSGRIDSLRIAWSKIYYELMTDETRISLEGTGLVRWKLKWPEWIKTPSCLTNSPLSLSDCEARDLLFILLDTLRKNKAVEIITNGDCSLAWEDIGVNGNQLKVRLGPVGNQRSVQSWENKSNRRYKYLMRLLRKRGVTESNLAILTEDILKSVWTEIRECDKKATNSSETLLTIDSDAKRLNPLWYRLELLKDDDKLFVCQICGSIQHYSVLNVCSSYRCGGLLQEIFKRDLHPNHYRALYSGNLPDKLLRVEEHTAQLDNEIARTFQREFKENKINILSCSTTFELGVDLGDLDNIFLRNVPPESFNYAQRVGRSGRRIGKPGFAVTYCRRRPHDLFYFNNPEKMLSGKIKPPSLTLKNEKIAIRHLAATALSYYFKSDQIKFSSVKSLFNDLQEPYGVYLFKDYLIKNKEFIEKVFIQILDDELILKLGIDYSRWIDILTDENSSFRKAEVELISDYHNLQNLELESIQQKDYNKAQWAQKRIITILAEHPLAFLSRKTIIPKYGFPVDVVELDTHKISHQDSSSVSLQRDLSVAIAEFAPGSEVIANKKVWKSYGLKKVAEREWGSGTYAYCRTHNNFINISNKSEEIIKSELEARRCCEHMQIKKYIDPEFGFVTNRDKPKNPIGQVKRLITSRPYFADYVKGNNTKIHFDFVDLWKVEPGKLINISEGFRGRGFYICGRCGAGFNEVKKNHKNSFDKECNGRLGQYSLAHEFETDVLKIQFIDKDNSIDEPVSFAYSIGFSILEGAADVLDVPSSDLNVTITQSEGSIIPSIVLYDNVPGGAGLVSRLESEELFISVLKSSKERVSGNCGCGEETSCYACLRSYKNQYVHNQLKRGLVLSYLNNLSL